MSETTTDSGLVVVREDEDKPNQTRKGPHPTPIKPSKRKAKRRAAKLARKANR
jgi:hypothetical protein